MVKEGYKQTEVGVIPVDWEVVEIGSLGPWIGGGTPSKSKTEFWNGDIPWLSPKDFGDLLLTDSQDHITDEAISLSSSNKVCEETIVFVARSGVLRHTFPVSKIVGRSMAINQDVKAFLPSSKVSSDFLLYVLHGNDSRIRQETVKAGTTVESVDLTSFKRVQIPLPPNLHEQRAIAGALSDTDALLSALDALIGKKEAFKRGMMEGLLSGEIRLAGFEGEWETEPLGELAHIQTGKKNNQDKIATGKYPFFVRSPTVERIDSYSYEGEAILVPGEGNIGSIFHYVNGKFEVHQRVYKIDQFREDVFPQFIHHYMSEFFGGHALENSVKATVDSLRLPTFQEFTVSLPPLPEQRAIARVLSDLDAELSGLRARRAKLGLVKGGMMGELLSGAVRLV